MLETLNEVQEFDLRIDALRDERGQTPQELIEARARQEELERRRTEVQAAYDALEKRVKANELELGALQQRRKEASEGALRASSGKEASQYQNQELQFATRLQELEEDTLPLMEQLEGLGERLAELGGQLDELEPVLADLARTEEERVAGIDAEIERIDRERGALADGVSGPLLKQYEQVRRARRGVGLVEIVGNSQCGGCNVRLPIHVVQKAKRGTGVVRCPSCGRILWDKG